MAIQYINSQYVLMYPSGFRAADKDLLAGQNTEYNITNTKKLSKYDINNCYSYFQGDEIIIYLKGYFFKMLQTKVPSGNNLYAFVKIENKNATVEGNTIQLTTLVNISDSSVTLDASNQFKGLGFDTNVPTGCASVLVRNASGELIEQPFKLSSSEVRSGNTNKSIDEAIAEGVNTAQLNATNATIQNANVQTETVQDITVSSGDNTNIPVKGLENPTQSGKYHLISKGATNKPEWHEDFFYQDLDKNPTILNVFEQQWQAYCIFKANYNQSDKAVILIEIKNIDNNQIESRIFNYETLNYVNFNTITGAITNVDVDNPYNYFFFDYHSSLSATPSYDGVVIARIPSSSSASGEEEVLVSIAVTTGSNYTVSCTIYQI